MKINTDKLLKELNEKWGGINCPYCQSSIWTVDPSIVTPIQVDEHKTMKLGGSFQPLVSVSCKNCGNTVFVNSLMLGCLDGLEDGTKNGDGNEKQQ